LRGLHKLDPEREVIKKLKLANKAAQVQQRKKAKEGKKAFKAAREKFACYAVTNRLNKVLKGHGVCRQKYFTGTLAGKDCAKFLDKWPVMLEPIRVILKNQGIRRVPDPPQTQDGLDTEIDDFLSKLTRVLEIIFAIKYFVYRHEPLDTTERLNFRRLTIAYGDTLRLLKWSITIKGHGIECHLADEMDEFKDLHQFLEEGMERSHRDNNIEVKKQRNSSQDWCLQQTRILNTMAMKNAPSSIAFSAKMDTSRKRSRKEEDTILDAGKAAAAKAALVVRIQSIIDSLPPYVAPLEPWEDGYLHPTAAMHAAAGNDEDDSDSDSDSDSEKEGDSL
jgi:hypothetical protein